MSDKAKELAEWALEQVTGGKGIWQVNQDAKHRAISAELTRLAEVERRLSTVPEDFGPLIEALANAAENLGGRPIEGNSKRLTAARAALTEKIAALQFRLATCELALAAVCDTNGGELYWSRETLDGLTVKSVEIDDMGAKGVYFRVVEALDGRPK